MGWKDGILSFARDERVLLISLGFVTFSIVGTMTTVLALIRDEHEIPPKEPKTQYITQETEDSLELSTLEKLLMHPNYSIREVATKILCDRAINDNETLLRLLYGVTRPDYDERMQCLRALALLTGQTMGRNAQFHPPEYEASPADFCRPQWIVATQQRQGLLSISEIA